MKAIRDNSSWIRISLSVDATTACAWMGVSQSNIGVQLRRHISHPALPFSPFVDSQAAVEGIGKLDGFQVIN